MGQYWLPVNLDKKEYIDPHKLGCGLKLWEQIGGPDTGTSTALLILVAAMPEQRGGGDPPEDPIVGRWAGDRIALVGDYADDGDLVDSPFPASEIYHLCTGYIPEEDPTKPTPKYTAAWYKKNRFKDVTPQVAKYIEKIFDGKFKGTGWRQFVPNTPVSA